jgi:hypothetical protein
MDFIIELSMIVTKHDSIMVVVDKISKFIHLIPVKSTYKLNNIEKIFMKGIF